eukprot:TRINITY_DN506_c0_g2_i2.p1 TRINITY_DN506_c0_g2~~TRINITY_DN506_c0_g2_i2.p1  ORF type:complete len:1105 (-),score=333.20 TRINITY_DN506_c0_g2_i2:256-3570(-)
MAEAQYGEETYPEDNEDVMVDEGLEGEQLEGELEEPVEENAEDIGAEIQVEEQVLTGQQIVTDSFGELQLPPEQIEQLQHAWSLLIQGLGSRDAVADLLYNTFIHAAPSLESLFVTPQAVMAFRMFMGINTYIQSCGTPPRLKMAVETLAYGHMHMDVTIARVNIIRDAVIDMMVAELGSKLTSHSATGFVSLFNYIGGAMIYIKANYNERMNILQQSWKMANDASKNEERFASASMEAKAQQEAAADAGETTGNSGTEGSGMDAKQGQKGGAQDIPTTFKEMFQFNAAVMGFGQNLWMTEVLALFDNIVSNFQTVARVQEECYVLTVRIARVTPGRVNLPEFKSCMLASLRSLLPKEWTTAHEDSWAWCWERVETLLLENMGKTQRWEKAIENFYNSIDEATGYQLRQDMYTRFFAASPEGEAFFKQNMTYLHLLITKVLGLVSNMYRDPVQTVDEISGMGLRHVGYGIPTELFNPYVATICDVVKDIGADEVSLKAFSWSMSLVAQMMARTIQEGSTIVMKAININSPVAVKAAIACAARGVRAEWMLLITVGTRDISPFLWSVQSGAIEAAMAMLEDLLTIRADRDRYYYEVDFLFRRHEDLVSILLQDAPSLLQPLLDRMIWRSRLTVNGYRRTNYYLRHLLLSASGTFHLTLDWVSKAKDPKLMVHPMLAQLTDIVWTKIALRSFLQRKSWFILTLLIFVISQSIIKGYKHGSNDTDALRYTTFALRVFIYLFSMGYMLYMHSVKVMAAYRDGKVIAVAGKCKVPAYLLNWQESFNLILMLILVVMLCTEPILWCVDSPEAEEAIFVDDCDQANGLTKFYYTLNMIAMFLYWLLLLDLAVIHNRVSAYVLVCTRMLSEVTLFLIAIFSVLLTLSSALSCLQQSDEDFKAIPGGMMAMWEMLLAMFDQKRYEMLHEEPVVLVGIYCYMVTAAIFLMNLLIAQLTCSYTVIYADMVGYARMKRSNIIVETMPTVSRLRWESFKESLQLEQPIEFNEGDIGIKGGIQVLEPASAHPTTVDSIRRFGGTTSPLVQWPQLDENTDEDDRFERLEATVKRFMDSMTAKSSSRKKKLKGQSSGMGSGGGEAEGSGSGAFEEAAEEE